MRLIRQCQCPVSIYASDWQEIVTEFLEKLSDEELKKESKTEAKNDALSAIMKDIKALGQ